MNAKMDVIGVENKLIKLKSYRLEEEKNFNNIIQSLESLLQNYNSNNNRVNREKINFLKNKFKILEKIHNNNQFVINNHLEKYLQTNKYVVQRFKNII